tara:strand:- start:264 stop:479 length:216 start_codon:yes stop_codon:yes gene_type:complete
LQFFQNKLDQTLNFQECFAGLLGYGNLRKADAQRHWHNYPGKDVEPDDTVEALCITVEDKADISPDQFHLI